MNTLIDKRVNWFPFKRHKLYRPTLKTQICSPDPIKLKKSKISENKIKFNRERVSIKLNFIENLCVFFLLLFRFSITNFYWNCAALGGAGSHNIPVLFGTLYLPHHPNIQFLPNGFKNFPFVNWYGSDASNKIRVLYFLIHMEDKKNVIWRMKSRLVIKKEVEFYREYKFFISFFSEAGFLSRYFEFDFSLIFLLICLRIFLEWFGLILSRKVSGKFPFSKLSKFSVSNCQNFPFQTPKTIPKSSENSPRNNEKQKLSKNSIEN